MRRFLCGLLLVTIVMMLLAFAVKWTGMAFFAPVPLWLLPTAVIYFAIAYGVQYWLTVSGMNKHPKAFVQSFLAVTVAVLFVHIIVLVGGMLVNPAGGKRFAVAFLILYLVYTVYTTVGLVKFVKAASGK